MVTASIRYDYHICATYSIIMSHHYFRVLPPIHHVERPWFHPCVTTYCAFLEHLTLFEGQWNSQPLSLIFRNQY